MKTHTSSNTGCYAQRLCDCSGPINREHVVTRALLEAVWQGEQGGRVYGLTFLRATADEPAMLGIKALAAKILCSGHNSTLSPLDDEIVKLFRAIERLTMDEINYGPVGANSYVSGDFIERWMYKTLVNGLFSGNFPVPFENDFAGRHPEGDALDIIFRQASFPTGHGLFLTSDNSRMDHHVFRVAVVGHPVGIVGLRMWMMGSLFSLVLTDEIDAFPELTCATFRPKKIITARTRNAIVFSWKGESTDSELELRMSDKPTG